MSLFHRKPKPAHQLVATKNEYGYLQYRCSVCTRTFSSLADASWKHNREWCPGKLCYVDPSKKALPTYCIQGDQLKSEKRALRKRQEPIAYLCYELMRNYGGFSGGELQPQEYIPLYDIRECIPLEGAVPLPDFE